MKRHVFQWGMVKAPLGQSAVIICLLAALAAVFVATHGQVSAYTAANEVNASAQIKTVTVPSGRAVATLSGGCFWAMQAMFSQLKGVDSAGPGYAGGTTLNPTYEEVCTEATGYAETIQIIYDPKVISYHQLLEIYFHAIDPTELNRQGDDVGSSYRSAIFYHNADEKAEAARTIAEVNGSHLYSSPIVTQILPYTGFYPAEAYHNNYFVNNPDTPYCQLVVAPKVAHFQRLYHDLLKQKS